MRRPSLRAGPDASGFLNDDFYAALAWRDSKSLVDVLLALREMLRAPLARVTPYSLEDAESSWAQTICERLGAMVPQSSHSCNRSINMFSPLSALRTSIVRAQEAILFDSDALGILARKLRAAKDRHGELETRRRYARTVAASSHVRHTYGRVALSYCPNIPALWCRTCDQRLQARTADKIMSNATCPCSFNPANMHVLLAKKSVDASRVLAR